MLLQVNSSSLLIKANEDEGDSLRTGVQLRKKPGAYLAGYFEQQTLMSPFHLLNWLNLR